MNATDGPETRTIRSTPAGATLGAVCMLVSASLAIWLSGYVRMFAANRGLLQLLVAIPLACLASAGCLAYGGVLTFRQMMWAMLPVEGLVLIGVGVFGPGYRAWPWAVALSTVLFIPWVTGALLGSAMARQRPPRQPL